MKRVFSLALLLVACGTDKTIVDQPKPQPTPNVDACQVIPPTDFTNGIPSGWQKGTWMTVGTPTDKIDATADGMAFTGVGSNSRASLIRLFETPFDVSNCINVAFTIRGKIFHQSLNGSGRDDREAPLAVMIDFTDIDGVRHSSLSAFNGGETDDRLTTRMFWWGFSRMDRIGTWANVEPRVTPVFGSEFFTARKVLDVFPAKIHGVAIESSGWNPRSAVVKHFSLEADGHPKLVLP